MRGEDRAIDVFVYRYSICSTTEKKTPSNAAEFFLRGEGSKKNDGITEKKDYFTIGFICITPGFTVHKTRTGDALPVVATAHKG